MKPDEEEHILNLARYYRGFQHTGPEVIIGYKHIVYAVNLDNDSIEEISVTRDSQVSSFKRNPDISPGEQAAIIRLWDNHRRSIGESGYFVASVIRGRHAYKVDGAMRTVERLPESF